MKASIQANLQDHREVLDRLQEDPSYAATIELFAKSCIKALQQANKLLICGNGGSAADAQHIAAELSGRYLMDRPPLFVEALHVNTSYLTAVGNDYSFDEVYRRAVEAKGRKGDVLLALSTSGNSKNIVNAAQKALELDMICLGMTGAPDSALKEHCSHCLQVPSTHTPRIQEMHLLVGHTLCELIEQNLFG